MSACLPFLSRVLGTKFLGVLKYISSLGSKTRTLLLRPYTQITGARRTAANASKSSLEQQEDSKASDSDGYGGRRTAITKHITTTVVRADRPEEDEHELIGYSFRAGV